MKEMNHSQPVPFPHMQRDQKSGGLPVLRDLEGPICAHCGNLRYFPLLWFWSMVLQFRPGIAVRLCPLSTLGGYDNGCIEPQVFRSAHLRSSENIVRS